MVSSCRKHTTRHWWCRACRRSPAVRNDSMAPPLDPLHPANVITMNAGTSRVTPSEVRENGDCGSAPTEAPGISGGPASSAACHTAALSGDTSTSVPVSSDSGGFSGGDSGSSGVSAGGGDGGGGT